MVLSDPGRCQQNSSFYLGGWFAPGSQLSLVWKNGVDNQTSNIENNWFDNVEESFNLAQQNSLSLKIVYYLEPLVDQ